MKAKIETKIIYTSDDGKRRSTSPDDIRKYETAQLKQLFEKRTLISYIGPSTSLYRFAEGDLNTFKDFYENVNEKWTEFTNGYFVFIQDSSYDEIGEDYTLYSLDDYRDLVKEKVARYTNILESIDDTLMGRSVTGRD